MKQYRPLAILKETFPRELLTPRVAHEIRLDDNSKLLFIPLRAGGLALQVWKPGRAKDGHGYLLAGSAMLYDHAVTDLLAAISAARQDNWPPPEAA